MLTVSDCKREIRELHDFFVAWYCGELDNDAFVRVEQALGDDFERVDPSGAVAGRETVLEGIRRTYDRYEPGTFRIEVTNIEVIDIRDERALLRYEERQTTPDGPNSRLSTVLFVPSAADTPAQWRYLQETWLETPETLD